MAALNEKQSKELCRKIEQYILKDGYFILDMGDWDNLHIEYKPYVYGKNLEHADYTKITVTLDGYNVTDVLKVKYYFARNTLFSKYLGDNYVVYYTDKDTEHLDGGGEGSNLDEAAEFIANRFIELVEDKIMDKKLEARITRLEKLLSRKNERVQEISPIEKKAIDSLTALVGALRKAQKDCKAVGYDDRWSDLNWSKIANDLEIAESYLPRMPEIGLY